MEFTKNNINKYFSDWAIEAGEVIEKKSEKEDWDWFDFSSAINFMLGDIKEDMKKFISKVEVESFLEGANLTGRMAQEEIEELKDKSKQLHKFFKKLANPC